MKNNLDSLRHSCSHLLASAVLSLWPSTKLAIGPVIENGFYYDFEFDQTISDKDFSRIEQKMHEIVKTWSSFERKEISSEEADKVFHDNVYKKELIKELADKKEKVSLYQSGNFVDLCRGGHTEHPNNNLKHFKLLSIAGAYWRGNEKNKMLTRIYGTCFPTKEELDTYLWQQEEAKKRDHRKLGKELDLFVLNENIGKGLPLLTPKGTVIREEILKLEAKLQKKYDFQRVVTPHIARSEMYKKTGHWQHYREVMYAPFGIEGEEYVLKPMNCPHHYMIYASKPRSYRELPIRLSEAGMCYRFEKTGELSGLLRVRALSIDDSHILMREDQIEDEFKKCIEMVRTMFESFQLNNYYVRLSLADPSDAVKYIADDETWKKAGDKLEKIIKDNNLNYVIAQGEASFYGPKIDFIVKDSLGREWQMSTLQLDLFMGKKLDLTYIDEHGKVNNPIILHQGLTGSIERTLGILIEHFAGAFPIWLSPVQVSIITVSEKYEDSAKLLAKRLVEANIRVEINADNDSLGKKIRRSTLQKVPFMVIMGEKEQEALTFSEKTIAVRLRNGEQKQLTIDLFIANLREQIEKYR